MKAEFRMDSHRSLLDYQLYVVISAASFLLNGNGSYYSYCWICLTVINLKCYDTEKQ